ncbi:NYN domain-containing protein [Salininema proteolyticum]|uniref:NYN domain-containing protein n=1 Tax=Salininema proteolyticum TaxID=1607685 RepID=A0ABV8TTM1_9ACTN
MSRRDGLPWAGKRYAVLVDVGYLYAAAAEILLDVGSRRDYRVDAEKLISMLIERAADIMPDCELLRMYWFDAARDRVPTVDQRVIAQMEYVKVRLGNLNSRGQQKGVDAMIRTDLEQLARHRAIHEAVLLAGDEDMVPAVEIAQAYGVRIHLWGVEPLYATNQSERLVWESDTKDMLTPDELKPFFTRAGHSPAAVAAHKIAGAPMAEPTPKVPSPAAVFGQRESVAVTMTAADALEAAESAREQYVPSKNYAKGKIDSEEVRGIGEFVGHKWLLTRGVDNIADLLPGPQLPTVIDKELLVEAEKELGYSLRDHPEARIWVRDGFWERIHREFDLDIDECED